MANHFSVRWIASLSICTALLTLVAVAFTKEMLDEPKVWPYAEMQWTKDQVLPSVQSVLLWGNPETGEHGMLRRFPAGYAPPPHMHPSAERVVVVSGTIVVRHTGASATPHRAPSDVFAATAPADRDSRNTANQSWPAVH